MAEHDLKNADQSKAIHSIRREHRINRVALPLAVFYVFYLMWTVLTDLGLFLRIVTVAFFYYTCLFYYLWNYVFE